MGNPGTGKTTVARQLGKILHDVGVRKATKDEMQVTIKLKDPMPYRLGADVVQGSNTGKVIQLGTPTTNMTVQSSVKDLIVKMSNASQTLTKGANTTIDGQAVIVENAVAKKTIGDPVFVETYPAKLMNDGQKKFDALIESAIGGVLFIDEAYSLNPASNSAGQPIFDTLMLAASNHKKDLTIILAGYKDDLEKKLYSYNVGLKRRFPVELMFEDFSEDELLQIWNKLLYDSAERDKDGTIVPGKEGWRVETEKKGDVSVVAARRAARGIGRKGHGNAAVISSMFENAKETAMGRKDYYPSDLCLTMTDVIGHDPSNRAKIPLLDKALKKLDTFTGLHEVKAAIHALVAAASENYKREMSGHEIHVFALNRLFLGNPGTGKTSIAEIYGMVLKALRYLSDGTVEYKVANDFIGGAVGQSQTQTSAIIKNCEGKVLLIDEAYNLDDQDYGSKALDTIVELVSAKPGANMAVIMAGYEKKMTKMLRDQNAGLSRRFDPASALYFHDFDNKSLGLILKRNCQKQNLTLSMNVRRAVVQELSMLRSLPHFGNAGAVESLLSEAKKRAIQRLQGRKGGAANLSGGMTLLKEDFNIGDKGDPYEKLEEMGEMVKDIVTHFKEMESALKTAEKLSLPRPKLGHYIFKGNSGTGKTTVAKCMASILYRMGNPRMLPTDRCVVVSAASLCGKYIGEAQDIVRKQFEEAIGGVLLIDEAYELGKSSYGVEALTTIVALLTEDDFKGKFCCVLAGYDEDMDRMLDTNQGARSRFPNTLMFKDWEPENCLDLCLKFAEKNKIKLDVGNDEIKAAMLVRVQFYFWFPQLLVFLVTFVSTDVLLFFFSFFFSSPACGQ